MRNVYEKEVKEWMRLDEYVRMMGFILNCVVMFEEDFSILFLMCNLVVKLFLVDFFEEKF